MEEGKRLHDEKKYEEAIMKLSEVIEKEPQNEDAYYYRGSSYYELKEFRRAIDDYSKALLLYPQWPAAWNERGLSYHRLKMFPLAIQDFTKALGFESKQRRAYFLNRGDSFTYLKEHRKALSDYSSSIEISPDYDLAYNNRGRSFYKLEEYQNAAVDFTKAIEIDSNYSFAYNNRALAYLGLGRYQEAMWDSQKSVSLTLHAQDHPNVWKIYRTRGLIFQSLKNYEKAIEDFRKASRLASLSKVCCDMEEYHEVLELLHKATEMRTAEMIDKVNGFIEPLRRENEELKKKMEEMEQEREVQLDFLRKENGELKKKQVDLERKVRQQEQKLEEVKVDYLDHKEEHHTLKFGILSIESTKMTQDPKTKEFSCFEGKHEMEISFKMLVGKLSGAFDFSDLKLTLNDEPVKDIMKMPRSIEFDLDSSKPGKNVLVLEFKNIKKKWVINVSSCNISCSKSELYLRKKETRESTDQEFRTNEEIEVYVHYRNEEGLGIPFEALEDLDFLMKVNPLGSMKKVKGIGGAIDLDEEMFLGDGLVLLSTFKMKEGEKTKVGKYQVVVVREDFTKTCTFSVQ